MAEVRIYTIDEAIEEIRRMHDRSKNRPFLAGIHGPQHAGKTYFRKKVKEQLHDRNLPKWKVDVYSTTNHYFDYILEKHYAELEYLFYEIGCNWVTPTQVDINLWNQKIKPYTSRHTDANMLIFNPKFVSPNIEALLKTFDIVISNPDSKKKQL